VPKRIAPRSDGPSDFKMRIKFAAGLTATLVFSALPVSSSPPQAGASVLVGTEPAGSSTTLRLITTAPFSSTSIPGPPTRLAAISRFPTELVLSCTGGWDDGGNLYHLFPNGNVYVAGPTGYGSVPALAWDSTGAVLWGVTGGFSGADLVSLDPFTGAATKIGATGVVGIESLADRPSTGVLYGVTGWHYDGTPGDVFTIDKATGAATDTGFDLEDSPGGGAPCTVSGLAFSNDGSTGYASIGCGGWGPGAGMLYRFTPGTFALTPVGQATGGGSMSGVTVIF